MKYSIEPHASTVCHYLNRLDISETNNHQLRPFSGLGVNVEIAVPFFSLLMANATTKKNYWFTPGTRVADVIRKYFHLPLDDWKSELHDEGGLELTEADSVVVFGTAKDRVG